MNGPISATDLAVAAAGALLAWLLTGAMRRYALAAQIIDVPNARSSHTRPTPRGGGVAIVASFTLLAAWRLAGGAPAFTAMLAGALAVAAVGYLDDRRPLPARWRLLVHAAAAAWVVAGIGGSVPLPIAGHRIDLGWFGSVLGVIWVVWVVNLYNFMDGIDGIASIEAITVSLGGSLCWWLAAPSALAGAPLLFAACVAGFLVWNYPPARIFMGDAGSGFIGMVFGSFSLLAAAQEGRLFWCWMVLLGAFVVDATTTLLRRVARGEKFYEAHRSHAYQYASRVHGSHRAVSLAFGALTLLWLLPLAVLVAIGHVDGLLATAIAYAPLLVLALRYKAGDRVAQEERS